jgi:hypothetical protein
MKMMAIVKTARKKFTKGCISFASAADSVALDIAL